MRELDAVLRFVQEAEGLKSVTRTAWTSTGRRESTAEHSWRLALLSLLMLDFYPELDKAKVLSLCLIHDLGERYEGDRCASDLPDPVEKAQAEHAAMERLCTPLAPEQGRGVLALWREYEDAATPEARLVKALDKAETILQHNQGQNPPDFDYDFNLDYGKGLFLGDPILRALRAELDLETVKRMEEQQGAL